MVEGGFLGLRDLIQVSWAQGSDLVRLFRVKSFVEGVGFRFHVLGSRLKYEGQGLSVKGSGFRVKGVE